MRGSWRNSRHRIIAIRFIDGFRCSDRYRIKVRVQKPVDDPADCAGAWYVPVDEPAGFAVPVDDPAAGAWYVPVDEPAGFAVPVDDPVDDPAAGAL
jgi:hypothetical protein